MAFPPGVQTVTLTAGAAGYRSPDGTPYQGTIRLTPSVPRVVSAEHGVIALGSVNITLGASGEFTHEFLATDADGFLPAGYTLRVDEEFTNAPGRAYSILLPAAVPTVALPSLVEVEASDGTTVWMASTAGGDLSGTYPNPSVARVNGVAVTGTPAAGQVPTATSSTTATWQAPAGGGGSGTPSDTVTSETGYGQSANAGAASTFARGDHTHGTPATPTVGTTTGTYAAGNDSRITGAAQKAQNLADLADPATARTSLGLGTAAVQSAGAFDAAGAASTAVSGHAGAVDPHADRAYTDTQVAARVPTSRQITAGTGLTGGGNLTADRTLTVAYGTTAGTAAVGNDSRLADARTPAGAASGDLAGTYPGPTVAKVNGIAVSGTPSSGYVLTATSASAASWQPPSGGGSSIRTARVRITDDDLSGLPAAVAWTVVQTSAGTQLKCSVTAVAGDRIRVCGNCMYIGARYFDWVLLDSGGAISEYATSEGATPPIEGNPTMYNSRTYGSLNNPEMFTVGAGHINAGMATVALAHQGAGTGPGNIVYAHTSYPFRLRLENIGPEPA
jgi:hypothetical protein